jgi:hypothetical protein
MSQQTADKKLCPNGHLMNAEWQVCPYCPAGSRARPDAAAGSRAQRPASGLSPTIQVDLAAQRKPAAPLAPTVRLSTPEGWQPPAGAPTVRLDKAVAGDSAKAAPKEAPTAPSAAPEADAARKTVFMQRPVTTSGIAWLVGVAGTARGVQHRLDKERVTIGAARECDAILDHPHVSDRHASLRCKGREFLLTDLDSTNGTFVNEEAVSQHALNDGDRVRFGSSEWIFKCVFFDESK